MKILGIGNAIVKKLNSLNANIMATGTNDLKLKKIVNDFPKIKIDEDLIEKFAPKIFLPPKNLMLQIVRNAFSQSFAPIGAILGE